MSTITVPLDGRPTSIERRSIPLGEILLDDENPRIQYYLDTRLNDPVTQDEVRLALEVKNDQYDALRDHIERNGGIYNPIWVVPQSGFYRVIEGNTRALAYSELADKYVSDDRWKWMNRRARERPKE